MAHSKLRAKQLGRAVGDNLCTRGRTRHEHGELAIHILNRDAPPRVNELLNLLVHPGSAVNVVQDGFEGNHQTLRSAVQRDGDCQLLAGIQVAVFVVEFVVNVDGRGVRIGRWRSRDVTGRSGATPGSSPNSAINAGWFVSMARH